LAIQAVKTPKVDTGSSYREIPIHAVPWLHEQCGSLIKTLPLPDRARVLDLGAGEGAFTLRLLDAGFEVTAVELDENRFSLNADCQNLDLNQEFHDNWNNKFDLIVAIEVIEHLNDPRHFIRNCLNLLKSDGFLLVTSPNAESWLSRIRFLRDGRFLWFEENDYSSHGHVTPIFSWQMRQICAELAAELIQLSNTRNALLRKRLGSSWLSVLRNKALYLSTLYPLMKGRKDGEVSIYLIRKTRAQGLQTAGANAKTMRLW
jgi:2-polyprenyl-3-methyl-5-hydroxy-6-metoxy-1,4-benzoquinol methylase